MTKDSCILCNKKPDNEYCTRCLICGEVICFITCSPYSKNEKSPLMGNLTAHAHKKHAG